MGSVELDEEAGLGVRAGDVCERWGEVCERLRGRLRVESDSTSRCRRVTSVRSCSTSVVRVGVVTAAMEGV